jgi:hypothetical protein
MSITIRRLGRDFTPSAVHYPGMFARYYPLTGKGHRWLATVHPADRKAFSQLGNSCRKEGSGKPGGETRAKDAIRCQCGAFVGKSQAYRLILGQPCWHNRKPAVKQEIEF